MMDESREARSGREAPAEKIGKPRFGFVALVGRPNCGKSTLLNTILGEELCVVTPLPQTTRRTLRGVYTDTNMQLVFVDTPGIHRGTHSFNKAMLRESSAILAERGVDIAGYIVDSSRDFGDEEDLVADMVASARIPCVIVFNKADICEDTQRKAAAFRERFPRLHDAPHIVLSAIDPAAKPLFLDMVRPMLPEGVPMFPAADLTDATMRFFAAEYLQKAIILCTQDEVPHASCVEILEYKEMPEQHVVQAAIHVETKGQRGILIGKGGTMIGRIRRIAEHELSRLAGVPVSFRCHVKVSSGWRDNASFLGSMGFRRK